MFCREQVARLRDEVERIRERGAELVVVGNGSVEQARAFRDERGLPFALFTDPSLDSYREAGLRRDLASSFHPRIAVRGLDVLAHGFRQGSTQGDGWQQGGAFVIAPGGRLRYAYVSRHAGDHPDPSDLLRALDEDVPEE